jgi:hypothetical protein
LTFAQAHSQCTSVLDSLKVFNKTIDKSKYMRPGRPSITIKRKKEGEVHLDGEPAIMGKKLKIEIVKQGLKVIMP